MMIELKIVTEADLKPWTPKRVTVGVIYADGEIIGTVTAFAGDERCDISPTAPAAFHRAAEHVERWGPRFESQSDRMSIDASLDLVCGAMVRGAIPNPFEIKARGAEGRL